MEKVILSAVSILFFGMFLNAQTASSTGSKKLDLTGRPADHFVLEFQNISLFGKPDSVKTSGFSRGFNIYFMYDKPFATNPKFSLSFGGGLGTSNIFFDNKTYVDVKSTANTLPFRTIDAASNHFSKFKVSTIYLEAPVELRYYSDPVHPNSSWKTSIGLKLGTLLKAYSKGKNMVSSTGASINGKSYIEKEQSKRFFNATNVAVSGKISYGIFGISVTQNLTPLLRDSYGPVMHKFAVGFTISGL